jgi:hypothetical protein
LNTARSESSSPLYAAVQTRVASSPLVPTTWEKLPAPEGGDPGPTTKLPSVPEVVVALPTSEAVVASKFWMLQPFKLALLTTTPVVVFSKS